MWLYTKQRRKGLSTKLMKPWHGPFRIVKMVSPVNARLEDVIKRKFRPIVHISRLKKFIQPSQPKEEREISEDQEYEVEEILDVKKEDNGTWFKIKWKGYDHSNDTWESEENLNCEELEKEFYERKGLLCQVCNFIAMSEKGLRIHETLSYEGRVKTLHLIMYFRS